MVLNGHDDKEFTNISLEECLSLCASEQAFVCRSVDYSPADFTWYNGIPNCQLSRDTGKTNPEALLDLSASNFNQYERVFN